MTPTDFQACVDVAKAHGSTSEEVRAVLIDAARKTMTPTEIQAAHPKCGTCGHAEVANKFAAKCNNKASAAHLNIVSTITEYCPHHTELTNQQKETDQ